MGIGLTSRMYVVTLGQMGVVMKLGCSLGTYIPVFQSLQSIIVVQFILGTGF